MHLPSRQERWHLVKLSQIWDDPLFFSPKSLWLCKKTIRLGTECIRRAGCFRSLLVHSQQNFRHPCMKTQRWGILPLHLEDHPCLELPAHQECPVNQNCWVKLASDYHCPNSSRNRGHKKKMEEETELFIKQSNHCYPTSNSIISSFQIGLSFLHQLTQFPLGKRWRSIIKDSFQADNSNNSMAFPSCLK